MQRWLVPIALSAIIAGVFAWLFATEQGALMRRQLMKQGQLMLEQGEQNLDQVGRQVQGGAQELLDTGHRLVGNVTKQLK